jgi:FkbM family methyltransferase
VKLIKTRLGESKFYYRSDDRFIGQRVALGKYEPYETKLILRQLKPNQVVIDVGANIGYYTMLIANKVKKVYALEPDKTNFEILKKNILANNLKNVVAIRAAAGSKKSRLNLYKSKENLGDHKLYGDGKKERVRVVKLDELVREQVNLIKIDTQGWEPEVVAGAKKIITKDKPIIFMEYSPARYKIAGLDGKKMMRFLRKIYKNIWWIDEWLYIYKNLEQRKIDAICATNKTGYADLWMKKEVGWGDKMEGIKDLKIKNLIKKILKYE